MTAWCPLVSAKLTENIQRKAKIMTAARTLHILNTTMSLGLNLLIPKLGLNPRWRYLLWCVVIANELRGLAVVWQIGSTTLKAVS
jgi:hypothetical protein